MKRVLWSHRAEAASWPDPSVPQTHAHAHTAPSPAGQVPLDSRAEAYCSFDGKNRQMLAPGDSVSIQLSRWPVPMVCRTDASHDWFLSVREGLSWNQRKAQSGADLLQEAALRAAPLG